MAIDVRNEVCQDAARIERELAAVRLPLEEATTLPGRYYHDPEIFRAELRMIFSKMWLCIGREEDVPKPGDFLTQAVGSENVMVLRDAGGQLNAFHNVCRHRGSKLLDQESGCGLHHVLCPYHAWSYHLDGSLRNAPHMGDARNFDGAQFGLNRVRLERWSGFLFINFSDDGPGLLDFLGEMTTYFERYQIGRLRRGKRVKYTVQSNWKMLLENYAECYHCALIHPEFNRISHYMSGEVGLVNPAVLGSYMTLAKEEYQTLTNSGRTQRQPLPGTLPEDRGRVHFYTLNPNIFFNLHPDCLVIHTVWPQAPGRCEVICDFYFDPDEIATPGFDPSDIVDFWDRVNRQDWIACEGSFQGTKSSGYIAGPLSPMEWMVHAFDNFVADRLTGKSEPTPVRRGNWPKAADVCGLGPHE